MNKLAILLFAFLITGCAAQQKASNNNIMANEPFIIYKTKADYNNLVPVILNDAKTLIVSYPGPADLRNGDVLRIPTQLDGGYLLDNRGIGSNVAYTSYTFEEYAALDQAPSISELMNRIIDKDPLLELYNCKDHIKIKDDIKKVNKLVKNDFNNCVKLK